MRSRSPRSWYRYAPMGASCGAVIPKGGAEASDDQLPMRRVGATGGLCDNDAVHTVLRDLPPHGEVEVAVCPIHEGLIVGPSPGVRED